MQDDQRPEIDLKQAVRMAIKEVIDLYEVQGYQLTDLLLEEVQRSDDQWHITVRFTRPTTIGGALAGPRRAFKRVRINAETGEFLGMEIRELQS